MVKERVQEGPTSKDVILETLLADLAPGNLSAASITALQEEFPLRVGNIQEDATTLNAKTYTFFIYSQAEGSLIDPSTMSVGNIQEHTATTMKAKTDTSFIYSQAVGSQSSPSIMAASMEKSVKQDFQKHDSSNEDRVAIQSTNQEEFMKQPRGSSDMHLGKEFARTTKETRDTNVEDGTKSEKAETANVLAHTCDCKPNIPMKDNTSQNDVIACSPHESQTGAAGSPILEIDEILELVELKDEEAALLVKALELYPQLRLSCGQRTRPIIAFSYKVLIDILLMLATKTPRTITTLDKVTLEENLGAATFLGFDKDWIVSVRDKVVGVDMFDVIAVEEEIQLKAELEKCDIMLEQVRKQRVEIKEQIVGVIRLLESEFEAIDSQLLGLLENRENLIKKMMELRGRISAKDRPFGI